MSSQASEIDAAAASPIADGAPPATLPQRLEALMVRAGDRLNPILVKECRQALKSKQFSITFVLVLALCWLWSIVEVAMIGPRIYYSGEGAEMFFGYYIILAFCLSLIIPYFTYRSMVSEREDSTYELLSITTLKPRQIVAGKLGSAAVQMMVYLSAVAPCLAFTYMLRGIDIIMVGMLLLYAVLGSMGLAMIGLFFATLTRLRYAQVLLSVVLIGGLIFVFGACWGGTYELLNYSARYIYDEETWIGNAIVLTLYVTYFIQVFLAATALLTFASENRSTALRWGMLLQHGCIAGWMVFAGLMEEHTAEIAVVMMVLLGIHWYAMGVLMSGESTAMSDRVKRKLPQSFLGRLTLTWFNPGPATGFVFVVVNMLSGVVLCLIAMSVHAVAGTPTSFIAWSSAIAFAVLMTAYVTFFLGLGNLLLMLLRRYMPVNMITSMLVQLVLIAVFCLVPLLLQLMFRSAYYDDYSLLQMTNVFWSLAVVVDRNTLPWEASALLICIPAVAIAVWLANLPMVAAAVRHVRIERPERLIEEEAQLKAAAAGPTSPWD